MKELSVVRLLYSQLWADWYWKDIYYGGRKEPRRITFMGRSMYAYQLVTACYIELFFYTGSIVRDYSTSFKPAV